MVIALLISGFTQHDVGGSSTAGAGSGPAAHIPGDGPIVTRSSVGLRSRSLPARTVALTFDDGPDPQWTPKVLALLAREHVPATFFIVGSRAGRHPDLVRKEIAAGDEIGSHTFSHANLATVPGWRAGLELSVNQLALTGSAGITTSLLRLPYSSQPDALHTRDLNAVRRATSDGYTVVFTNRDSEDWRRPGKSAIVHNALPTGDDGAIILFHDAGGNRSQTLAALPDVIHQLKSRGYRFSTVSGALGLATTTGMRHVGTLSRLPGIALLVVLRCASWVTTLLTWLLFPLGLLILLRTALVMLLARRHVWAVRARQPDNGFRPLVSVIVPAYNEAVGIEAAVRSVLASNYPSFEVVVVDDGSTDDTAKIVESIDRWNLRLIRQANAGKAGALSTGIRFARCDVIVMMDGDTIFQPDTIRWLVQPLKDPRVGAVSGNTKVGNREGLLGRWQHIEYVMGFNLDRRMYDILHCMPTVPGAVGAFTRETVTRLGGVSDDTLAEDTDLTMAVNRAGLHVVYEERAVAWTEAPQKLSTLWRQRYRWCYGTLQAVWKHRSAFRSRGAGRQLGRVGLPYLLAFQFLLPLLAPVVDIYALYGLLFLNPYKVAAYWLGFLAIQLFTAGYALRLDRERLRPLWSLVFQQLVYRQLMYLVVIQSVLSALSGVRLRWHKSDRSGNLAPDTSEPQDFVR